MKIVMCASEVVPFAKTGGLADVAGALSLALEKEKQEVIIIMPRYKTVDSVKFNLKKLNSDISYSIIGNNIKVYFIEKDEYFNRDGLYGDKNGDHKDNLDRFVYYCRSSLRLLKEINFQPDIIHCHDWQSSLVPVYLKTIYAFDRFYKDTRTVLTIHNIGYQGLFLKEEFLKLGLDWNLFDMEGLEFYGKINILKGGMVFSDVINTVSPTYAKEIETKEFGFGLEGVLTKRHNSVFGILNGLDYDIWNPQTDEFITKNFSVLKPGGKAKNKESLQALCNFPKAKDVPLVGIVSRLVEAKGFDILAEGIDEICKMGIQMVILGTGDLKYHQILEEVVKKYPKSISLHLKFDDSLAHKIYAGSDIFLMPSKYEPCGLGQLIALRYGAIPLVFRTGGLADTVNSTNGFVFNSYNKISLVKTINRAIAGFSDKKKWDSLVLRAMKCNFSWGTSAKKYLGLYAKAKEK
ncbi:MAG: glycogen synthase GlgA [Candidatus Omnitrophica bacterium CG08_land_8_20_14_0_20_41_16]|uniref:Glycogen synthase n=1 Tax=Candidatus Sherwoodlollariibacterium unditelluris TaxID=1974757 RepID=A0A2G9YL41_9BACT|nr:MAG: glycogen synthase GlgA [Candidatus Omnitrophica bacterium CG23_combo_of_CG06-09_8_20_14_all_41_10]PIS34024.1 MAG: glycogen synthase GlgA [Candidatus Omnitrophica bacterium CG08_land_8_20_14_0_20_41_16]